MGVLSCVTTPAEAHSKISNRYKAVIVTTPEKTYVTSELIRTLKAYSLDTPIFALCESPEAFRELYPEKYVLYDKVFSTHTCSSTLLTNINSYRAERGLSPIGIYRLSGIDASANLREPMFFSKALKLTKTELMILRYLMTMYPVHVSAKLIIANSFKPGRHPELASVRTHICAINKKFYELTGRYWISAEPGVGYRILTPELICSK
jgi:hypothetical protein